MYKLGKVSAVDAELCRARVRFPAQDDIESPWLEVLQGNAGKNRDQRLPDEGELVAVLLDEREEAGCILGAIYTAGNKPPVPSGNKRRVEFEDGTVVEYDRASHVLTVDVGSGTVELTASTVHIDGNVKVGGGAEAVALADKVATELNGLYQYLGSHTHPAPGGATGAPVPPPTAPGQVAASKLTSD